MMLRRCAGVLGALISVLLTSPGFAQQTQVTRAAWQFGCGDAASGTRICQIQRDVVAGTGNGVGDKLVMQILITREPGAHEELLRFVTPHGVDLKSGLSYSVTHKGETSALRMLDYKTCSGRGCIALVAFNDDEIEAFIKGRKMDVAYTAGDLNQVNVSIDLKGFKAVHKKLEKATK